MLSNLVIKWQLEILVKILIPYKQAQLKCELILRVLTLNDKKYIELVHHFTNKKDTKEKVLESHLFSCKLFKHCM